MLRYLVSLLLCGFVFNHLSSAAVPERSLLSERIIEFSYSAEIPAVLAGKGPVEVFLPLAQSDDYQTIISRELLTEVEGVIKREKKYGNSYWHAILDHTEGKPQRVTIKYTIKRKLFNGFTPSVEPAVVSAEELSVFLQPNLRVPIGGELIERIRAELPKTAISPRERAKAIYDYVVDNMEYKKVGSGWGNGDTYWACSKKYGNCTDFHALFISLARAEGIPSRFEIGFPIPIDKAEGNVGGYHCWVTFYLPGEGWIPIDASEAKKHPEKRELFFGTHPTDRIQFTRGRDLKLNDEQSRRALNYFIYPHIEVGGRALEKVQTEFSYREISHQN